jgi:malate dehydrogenase (oxaloacetate-decarboxylating)
MATPSPGYSITVRVEAPTDPAATARLSSVVAEAGGAITALDVAESHADMLVVDVSCNASDVAHSSRSPRLLPHSKASTFGRCRIVPSCCTSAARSKVTPKVPLTHRDDLSRAYTPGSGPGVPGDR